MFSLVLVSLVACLWLAVMRWMPLSSATGAEATHNITASSRLYGGVQPMHHIYLALLSLLSCL
jgi:hypothetical protein